MGAKLLNGYQNPMPSHPNIILTAGSEGKMMAVYYHEHGTSSVLKLSDEFPKPMPIKGQALVRIRAACVNPVDIKLRSNELNGWIIPKPKIIGSDFCGVVEDVGMCKESPLAVGDRVICMIPYIFTPWGSTCQYAAVDWPLLAKITSSISDVEASSVPLVGLTVLQAFRNFIFSHNGDTVGKKVLIQAGSGGLGTFAIQYCKLKLGMYVVATCSTANVPLLRSLGADEVLDYTQPDQQFVDVVRDCDVVFDPLAYKLEQRTLASNVLKQDGFYINVASSPHSLQPEDRSILKISIPDVRPERLLRAWLYSAWLRTSALWKGSDRSRKYELVIVRADSAALRALAAMLDEGQRLREGSDSGGGGERARGLHAVVDSVYPIERAAEAHDRVEGGHARGKVVITIP